MSNDLNLYRQSLFEFSISKVDFNVSERGSLEEKDFLEIKMTALLACNYYNFKAVSFEPCLEEIPIKVIASKPNLEAPIQMNIHSNSFLNFYVTEGLAMSLRLIIDRV